MSKNKVGRLFINVIGVPSLLLIVYLGDGFYNIPIFSLFVLTILFLAISEMPALYAPLVERRYKYILFTFIFFLQIFRLKLFYLNISYFDILIIMTIITMLVEIFNQSENSLLNVASIFFSFVWIGLMLGSMSTLRNLDTIGYSITASLFLSVWACDSAAYIFGKKYGNKKILPKVSPNKTWVGTISGIIASILIMMILFYYGFFSEFITMRDIVSLGLISGIFGQAGDFSESLFKRSVNIKDTSNLLHGHGGILDRFDSLMFVTPLFLIYCNYFL